MTPVSGQSADPTAQTATLGGAVITDNAPWQGKWNAPRLDGQGRVTVTVGATTATVLRPRR